MISDALKKNKEFIKDLDQEIRRVIKNLKFNNFSSINTCYFLVLTIGIKFVTVRPYKIKKLINNKLRIKKKVNHNIVMSVLIMMLKLMFSLKIKLKHCKKPGKTKEWENTYEFI